MKRVQLNAKARRKVQQIALEAKREKSGRPEFEPTEEQRTQVKVLAGRGFKQTEICFFILKTDGEPISVPTLLKHFRYELDIGMLEVASKIAGSLTEQALGLDAVFKPLLDDAGDIVYNKDGTARVIMVRPAVLPDVKAGIWFEKTRRGMKEGVTLEHTGKDGKDLPAGAQTVIYMLPDNGRSQPLLTDSKGAEVYAPDSGKGNHAKTV